MTRQFANLTAKHEWKLKHSFARSYMRDALQSNDFWEAWRNARLAAGYFFECFPYLKESA